MEFADSVVIVTGGARGIGRALVERFLQESPRGVILSDMNPELTRAVAAEIGAVPFTCDVTKEEQIRALVQFAEEQFGRVDVFCSNAGFTVKGGVETPDADWQRLWEVHVMSNVYAARAVLPGMLARQSGCLLQTASAAGLMTEVGSAAYSVTKHATVAFAEWLSVQYQKRGIRVSCLCPAGVQTEMLDGADPVHQFLQLHAVTPAELAERVLVGLKAEQFLIVSHPEVHEFFAYKTQDYDRWLANFARINQKLQKQAARATPSRADAED